MHHLNSKQCIAFEIVPIYMNGLTYFNNSCALTSMLVKFMETQENVK